MLICIHVVYSVSNLKAVEDEKMQTGKSSLELTPWSSAMFLTNIWTWVWLTYMDLYGRGPFKHFSMCTLHCTTSPATSAGQRTGVHMQTGSLKAFSPPNRITWMYISPGAVYSLREHPGWSPSSTSICCLAPFEVGTIGCSLVSWRSETSISQKSSFRIKCEWK